MGAIRVLRAWSLTLVEAEDPDGQATIEIFKPTIGLAKCSEQYPGSIYILDLGTVYSSSKRPDPIW